MRISYCDLIRELFPSYNDGTISEEDKSKVDEHLRECEACRSEFRKTNPLYVEVKKHDEVFEANEKIKKKKKRKKIIISSVLVLTFIAFMIFACTYEFSVDYMDVKDNLTVKESNGNIRITVKGCYPTTGFNETLSTDSVNKIINQAEYKNFNTTLWKKYISRNEYGIFDSEIESSTTLYENGKTVKYIYITTAVYFQKIKKGIIKGNSVTPDKPTGEPILLWEKKN